MRFDSNAHMHYIAQCPLFQVILRAAAGEVDNLVKKIGKRVHVPVSFEFAYIFHREQQNLVSLSPTLLFHGTRCISSMCVSDEILQLLWK